MKCTCEWEKTPAGVTYHPNEDCPFRIKHEDRS